MAIAKGKWKAEEMGGNIEITTSYRQRDGKVCIATVEVDFGEPFNQEQIDSAILIASAPALLEALEEYMRANKALSACSYDDPIKLRAARDDFFDAEKNANAAIAAARGK